MTQSKSVDFVQEYWMDVWQRSILTLDVLMPIIDRWSELKRQLGG